LATGTRHDEVGRGVDRGAKSDALGGGVGSAASTHMMLDGGDGTGIIGIDTGVIGNDRSAASTHMGGGGDGTPAEATATCANTTTVATPPCRIRNSNRPGPPNEANERSQCRRGA